LDGGCAKQAAATFNVVDWVLFRASSFPAELQLSGAEDRQGQFLPTRVERLERIDLVT
jgi:hypothetical protein